MTKSALTPTDEQILALEMAKRGQSFKVVAYAGAGKTTTLKLISSELKGRGLYLAFNKAIANDAVGKFGQNVRCQTFHSLAFRHVPRNITAKISLPRLTPTRLASELKLAGVSVSRMDSTQQPIMLSAVKLASMVSEALADFCKTSSAYPAPRHIKVPEWVSLPDQDRIREYLYPFLEQRWLQAIDPRHPFGIGHDIYLKLWTLSNPIIPADFVLFDEAQDADPLMMGVLVNQQKQVVYVGDAHQQIYEWRGAVNAMKRLPCEQTLLTQSFRFGEKIAQVANIFLNALQETTPLRGNPDKQSMLAKILDNGKKDAILCRTNATAIARLLEGQKRGHKVALQADSTRILRFCQGADKLKNGMMAESIPELAFFKNWREVQDFSESNEGADLKTWVRLIEEYGTKTITGAINHLTDVKTADYVVSTAHKAKGLEWQRVQIDDDFLYDVNSQSVKIRPEELRLLYVATTRAKEILDVTTILDLLKGLKNQEKKLLLTT